MVCSCSDGVLPAAEWHRRIKRGSCREFGFNVESTGIGAVHHTEEMVTMD
jgi:hypothetical protein